MLEARRFDLRNIDRRAFIGLGALATASAAAGLAGCAPSSATASGSGDAAQAAASQQGGFDFEQKPAAIDAASISETIECDVVVVGGSSTGLCAAASAAEEGAKVVCLEKEASSMGAGTYYGFINLDGGLAADPMEYAELLIAESQGMGNPRLIHAFTKHSEDVGRWMIDIATSTGTDYRTLERDGTTYFGNEEKGTSVYTMLIAYGEKLGAEYVFNMGAEQLVLDDDGTVTGVVAKKAEGDYVQYRAREGVILATGGYNGNSEMERKYIPWIDTSRMVEFSPIAARGNAGDGLKMALWAGAKIGEVPHTPMIHYISGGRPTAGQLSVNLNGERFAREGTSDEVMCEIVARQAGGTSFRVWDDKLQQVMLAAEEEASTTPGPKLSSVSEYTGYDTLEEAALSCGVDAEGLKRSVTRWNEMVSLGVDDDFGADLNESLTIDTAPFYIAEGPGNKMALMGGPKINENMQVVNEDGKPIAGLYAGGNCTCGFWGPNYPMRTAQSGIARAFTAVSGYVAGKAVTGF